MFPRFGKTYKSSGPGKFFETEHLCLYVTGDVQENNWHIKTVKADFYFLKGVVTALLKLIGLQADNFESFSHKKLQPAAEIKVNGTVVLQLGEVHRSMLNRFDIKQSVFFADIDWSTLMAQTKYTRIQVQEIPKFPVVHRDLALLDSGLKILHVDGPDAAHRLGRVRDCLLGCVFPALLRLGQNLNDFQHRHD